MPTTPKIRSWTQRAGERGKISLVSENWCETRPRGGRKKRRRKQKELEHEFLHGAKSEKGGGGRMRRTFSELLAQLQRGKGGKISGYRGDHYCANRHGEGRGRRKAGPESKL